MPKEAVWDAMDTEGLVQDKVIAALLDGYAHRPALGQRSYEVAIEQGAQQSNNQKK